MDKSGEKSKEIVAIYANKLPAEIVGRFLQKLSVGDRLKSGRVSPLWKRALSKWGWTEQMGLDASIVFEGESEEKFWDALNVGSCLLVSLLHQCGPWLRQLDLESFGRENIDRFFPQIIESLSALTVLEYLDFCEFDLRDFVEHLPPTLRELNITRFAWAGIGIEEFEALSVRCPNLEEAPFENLGNKDELDAETVIRLIGMFPRQKRLNLSWFTFPVGALASIGRLEELEVLIIRHCVGVDGELFAAIAEECKRLRTLSLDTDHHLTEEALFQLPKCPNLTTLVVHDAKGQFTDDVLKAIAQRGQLKELVVYGGNSEALSDNSIVYLVDRCKSLVSLYFHNCPQITERSLEAVVTEVKRRHGWPPRSLPSGPDDSGIFYFYRDSYPEGRMLDKAQESIGNNPWLEIGNDPR